MNQKVKCYNCNKIKEWTTGEPEPKWFTADVKNPYITGTHSAKITVNLCSKRCASDTIRKEM